MQNDPAASRKQLGLQVLKHLGDRSNAVDGENLPSLLSAGGEDPYKHPLLIGEATIVAGPGIETDLSDVASPRKQALEERQLARSLGDELGMQPKCDPHVF